MIQRNFEQEALEERRAAELAKANADARRLHELKLAELKLKYKPRIDGRTKIATTLLKAPAYPVALICVTILTLRGKTVPDILAEFLR